MTPLKSSAIVVFSDHVVILCLTPVFRRFLTYNGYSFAELHSVCTSANEYEELEERMEEQQFGNVWVVHPIFDALPTRMENDARVVKLEVPNDALQNVLQPFIDNLRPGFLETVFGKQCKYHPTPISFFCDISEMKDNSGLKHVDKLCPCSSTFTSIGEFLILFWVLHELLIIWMCVWSCLKARITCPKDFWFKMRGGMLMPR